MILNDLKTVKSINSNSTAGLISISNENFLKISNSLYKFLTDFQYNEEKKYLKASEIEASTFTVNSNLKMILNGNEMFRVDGNGRLFAKKMISESVVQSMINRLTYYEGFPKNGNPGEIVYGRNYDHQNIDFYGYIQNVGWVSLTGLSSYEPGDQTIMMPISVAAVISESLLPEGGTDSYIINDGEHSGAVAIWDPLNNKYQFNYYPEGSYILDQSGNVYICNEADAGELEWNKIITQSTIGYDEAGTDEYADGQYEDFDFDTRTGVAVDRFNKDVKKLYYTSQVAFKNIEGVAHTSNDIFYSDENFSGGITLPANNIFASDISDKTEAIQNGLVEEKISILSRIDSTNGYIIRDDGKIVKTVISKAFGPNYIVNVIDSQGRTVDPSKYIVQYAAGIVLMLDKTITPAKIEYSNYIGETLQNFVSSNSVKLAYSDNIKKVSRNTGSGNNQITNLVITSTPKKKSNIIVKVNGVSTRVCVVGSDTANYDCYFIDKENAGTVKSIDNIAEGDKLVWNSSTAGYSLDTNDIVSFDYLCDDNAGTSGGGEGGSSTMIVELIAGENISAYHFVHIAEDGMVYNSSANETGLEATGFVIESYNAGNTCKVYMSGIVDVISVNGNPGDYIYLTEDGGYSSSFGDDLILLQNVGTIVDTNKLFINIGESVFLGTSS